MIQIPITNLPNQSLSINLDSDQFDINIHACKDNPDGSTGIMTFDVTINNVIILTGERMVSGYQLIPYRYLENGNFVVQTMDNSYPDWRQFGITQFLVYASEGEIEALRAAA